MSSHLAPAAAAPLLLLLLLAHWGAPARGQAPEIFLPPDADFVTLVGQGVRVQIRIQETWKAVVDGSQEVQRPRPAASDDTVVVNADLKKQLEARQPTGSRSYGPLAQYGDLVGWIEARATALAERLDRYTTELQDDSLREGQRIVLQTLFLNVLTDLENLTREGVKSLRWIRYKIKSYTNFRQVYVNQVLQFVKARVQDNLDIERRLRGSTNPGSQWLRNTKLIRRILHEQKFSSDISQFIVDHLAGEFSNMKRSRVYDLFQKDANAEDQLVYRGAQGIVPAYFPFHSQDAMANGASSN